MGDLVDYDEAEHSRLLDELVIADRRLQKLSGQRSRNEPDFSKDEYRNAWYDRRDALMALSAMVDLLEHPE